MKLARLFSILTVTTFALTLSVLAAAAPKTGTVSGKIEVGVAKHRANTIVYVKNAGQGTSTAKAKMDQKGLVFAPRVLPIQKGTTVEFHNSDTVGHNVFTPDGDKYDLGTWTKGQTRKYTYKKTGVFRQLCKVHDDMIAFVVVLDTKYFAVSNKGGVFKLPALPPGKYTLGVWHEKLTADEITVEVVEGKNTEIKIPLKPKS